MGNTECDKNTWYKSRELKVCILTLVEEVDGFHTSIFLITDLQLVKFAKHIYQSLHHLHPILTEAADLETELTITLEKTMINNKYGSFSVLPITTQKTALVGLLTTKVPYIRGMCTMRTDNSALI